MRKINLLIVSCLIGFCASKNLCAAPNVYVVSTPPGKNRVQFFSKATVEDFEGTAEQISGSISADFSKPDLNLSGRFSVLVNQMQTGMAMRDKHMLSDEWLNARLYPAIRFDFTSVPLQAVKKTGDQQWFVKAKGTWTMKGISKEIEVPATLTQVTPDKVVMKSRFSVHLTDYGIHGPMGMRMLGVKVSPDVVVDLVLTGEVQKGWTKPPSPKRRL